MTLKVGEDMRRFGPVLLALLISANAALANRPARPQRSKRPAARPGKVKAESHPKIRAAIASLEAAKAELEHSDKDFGGHKKDAIEAVNNALKHLRLALQFEKY